MLSGKNKNIQNIAEKIIFPSEIVRGCPEGSFKAIRPWISKKMANIIKTIIFAQHFEITLKTLRLEQVKPYSMK
jgi:hypothetical protein